MPDQMPAVLCLSGHDPGGGAGIHADIEAVAAQGLHALTVITALTVQDSSNVYRVEAVAGELFEAQIGRLESDCHIAAIKVGLVGSVEQAAVIAALAARCRVPLVLDPVLRAGGGSNLASAALQDALLTLLLPRLTLLTPNAAEARRLAPAATLEQSAARLVELGCANLLITGGDEPGEQVENLWFRRGAETTHYAWPRLAETFHGAGCTLAAAIAARLALGQPLEDALPAAQAWVHQSLRRAIAVGRGRRIPLRH